MRTFRVASPLYVKQSHSRKTGYALERKNNHILNLSDKPPRAPAATSGTALRGAPSVRAATATAATVTASAAVAAEVTGFTAASEVTDAAAATEVTTEVTGTVGSTLTGTAGAAAVT